MLEIFSSIVYGDVIAASIILAVFFSIAKLVRIFMKRHFSKVEKVQKLEDEILDAVRKPLFYVIILIGVYLALLQIRALAEHRGVMKDIFAIVSILIGTYASLRIFRILEERYIVEVIDKRFLPSINKIVSIFIYAVAFIIILNQLDIEVTPLIASLGVATLAVGLALQDTLSNFFAGLYIMSDKPIRIGDYIELDTGDKGYVEEIGWRSTRIKTLPNNIVVVPNARLAQSRIVNYYLPEEEMSVVLQCGVGYASDLEKVEKVTIEVAREVQKTIPGAVKNFEPFIRYHTFGDSNINFSIILRVEKFVDQYLVVHELLKKLTRRYREEGIEISFPARVLYYQNLRRKIRR
ncbi:MAG: mechanosensitive ion channel family protein [Euryarchaeota archaeon]|nr:mechanosensitive ion channel family protein [Euryarchaeota archaeon]